MIGYVYELLNDNVSWYDNNLIDWDNDVILVALIFGEDEGVIIECFENSDYDYDCFCLMFKIKNNVLVAEDLEKIDAWQYKKMIDEIKTGI